MTARQLYQTAHPQVPVTLRCGISVLRSIKRYPQEEKSGRNALFVFNNDKVQSSRVARHALLQRVGRALPCCQVEGSNAAQGLMLQARYQSPMVDKKRTGRLID